MKATMLAECWPASDGVGYSSTCTTEWSPTVDGWNDALATQSDGDEYEQ